MLYRTVSCGWLTCGPAASSAAPGTAPGWARALSPGCVRAGLALLGQLVRLTAAATGTVSGQYCTNGFILSTP
jgi:hypothetical protein